MEQTSLFLQLEQGNQEIKAPYGQNFSAPLYWLEKASFLEKAPNHETQDFLLALHPPYFEMGNPHQTAPLSATSTSVAVADVAKKSKITPEQKVAPSHDLLLGSLFQTFLQDVTLHCQGLLSLNQSRRLSLERRLGSIARRKARLADEKYTRSIDLSELLKDYARQPQKTWAHLSLESFMAEVAVYQVFQIYLLQAFDRKDLRYFSVKDLRNANFEVHGFLSRHATGFMSDKNSYNFIRPSIYSWYIPSDAALMKISQMDFSGLSGSYEELQTWFSQLCEESELNYLNFETQTLPSEVWNLAEKVLKLKFVDTIQNEKFSKKVFLPSLENSSFSTELIRRFPEVASSLWVCDSEPFELYWGEIAALLLVLQNVHSVNPQLGPARDFVPQKLPLSPKFFQMLGLEAFPQDQQLFSSAAPQDFASSRGSSGSSSLQTLCQMESFDFSLVMDSPHRTRSSRWLKALQDQIPHLKSFMSSSTVLNWGELHLLVACRKLRDYGYCIYVSHRPLPDTQDGEKLRKYLLSNMTLEFAAVDLPWGDFKYLYIFQKNPQKNVRDAHVPKTTQNPVGPIETWEWNSSSHSQFEIQEGGWDQVFTGGAAPLVRYLNHKFPKLFQVASLHFSHQISPNAQEIFGESNYDPSRQPRFLSLRKKDRDIIVEPVFTKDFEDRILIVPRNLTDLPWLCALLNSKPVQFWVRMNLMSDSSHTHMKAHELRSIPVVDMSSVDHQQSQKCFDSLFHKNLDAKELDGWIASSTPSELSLKISVLSRIRLQLMAQLFRHRHLIRNPKAEIFEIHPEAVYKFYPRDQFISLMELPQVRVVLVGSEMTPSLPDHWILQDVTTLYQLSSGISGKNIPVDTRMTFVISTKQGPQIHLWVPQDYAFFVESQIKQFRDYTWGEVKQALKAPQDAQLFSVQCKDILSTLQSQSNKIKIIDRALENALLDLYEIPPSDRIYMNLLT